jgi:hypothetical protein
MAPTEPLVAATSSTASNASHSSLPVEIESVVEEPADQGNAPTMPLVMLESQSMAAPPMPPEEEGEEDDDQEAPAAEPEALAAEAERAGSEGRQDAPAASEVDFAEVAAESDAAAGLPEAAQAAEAARAEEPEEPEEDDEQDAPLPMGRAVTGPPPATRTGPVSRIRDKSKSGTKLGFPGVGQPAPELAAAAELRAAPEAGINAGTGAEASTDAGAASAGPAAAEATPEQQAAALRSSGMAK